MDLEELRANVTRGAALLDSKEPTWRSLIDVPSLDMGIDDSCVLGQVYATFDRGLDALGIHRDQDKGERYGFYSPSDRDYGAEYLTLTALWIEEIQKGE